jgi:N6-L-threonylcarbamoyladenine synthase
MSGFVLGIDTSNYTTSAAVVSSDGRVVSNERMLLDVKKGERGLRQQQALFLRPLPASVSA